MGKIYEITFIELPSMIYTNGTKAHQAWNRLEAQGDEPESFIIHESIQEYSDEKEEHISFLESVIGKLEQLLSYALDNGFDELIEIWGEDQLREYADNAQAKEGYERNMFLKRWQESQDRKAEILNAIQSIRES